MVLLDRFRQWPKSHVYTNNEKHFSATSDEIQQEPTKLNEDNASEKSYDSSSSRVTKFTSTMIIAILTASLNYAMHGYNNSTTNGILASNNFLRHFPSIDVIDADPQQLFTHSRLQGLTVGLYQVGCAAGAILCCFFSDRFGRKPLIHAIGAINIIGVILQTSAHSLGHLMAGRIITGIGVGSGHATFPMYLAECVPSELRGVSVLVCASAANFGHFIGAVIQVAFYFVHHQAQWRVPIGLELLFAVPTFILPFWCPESPRLLLRKHQFEKACDSWSDLTCRPVDSNDVRQDLKRIESNMEASGATDKGRPRRLFYRIFLGLFIQSMSSLSGIDVVSFFSTQTIEKQLHFSHLKSLYFTMGLQGTQWLFSTIAIFLVDTLGRRKLVLGCSLSLTFAMAALSGLTWQGVATSPMLKAAIAFYYMVMGAFPMGFHLVPSLYVAELSPARYKHMLTANAIALHFLCGFMITMVTPIAFASIHSRYYFVFVATNLCAFVVVLFLFPETAGFELEDIEEMFKRKKYLAIGPNPLKPKHITIETKIREHESQKLLQSVNTLCNAVNQSTNVPPVQPLRRRPSTLDGRAKDISTKPKRWNFHRRRHPRHRATMLLDSSDDMPIIMRSCEMGPSAYDVQSMQSVQSVQSKASKASKASAQSDSIVYTNEHAKPVHRTIEPLDEQKLEAQLVELSRPTKGDQTVSTGVQLVQHDERGAHPLVTFELDDKAVKRKAKQEAARRRKELRQKYRSLPGAWGDLGSL